MIHTREHNLNICMASIKQMRSILDGMEKCSGTREEVHTLRKHLKRAEDAVKAAVKAETAQEEQAQIPSAGPDLEVQMRLIASAIVEDLPQLSNGVGPEVTVSMITEIALRLVDYANDQEKAWRKQRQSDGIAAAKQRNQKFGHPKIPRSSEFPDVVKAWESGAISQSEARARLGLTRATFFRQLKEYRSELAARNSQQPEDLVPMESKGTLFFFTGLAGAGKTTIGGMFYQRLKEIKPDAILLDGDKQRNIAGQGSTVKSWSLVQDDDRIYSTEARKRGALTLAPWCRDQLNEGRDIVLCTISMYSEVRDWYQKNVDNFCEIYIKVNRNTLLKRNQKGLYSPGRRNVVGVDLPWDEPVASYAVIQNDGERTPEDIVDELAARLLVQQKEC